MFSRVMEKSSLLRFHSNGPVLFPYRSTHHSSLIARDRFCLNCGAPLGGGYPREPGWGQPQPPGEEQQSPWGQPSPRSQSPRLLLLLVLAILLLGLGGLAYWQFGSHLNLFSSSPTADTTPPKISKVAHDTTDPTETSAIITWVTDEPASSQVVYGTVASYGSVSPSTPQHDPSSGTSEGVTNHSVTLSGLTKGTTYHYKVKSKDAAGNLAESSDRTFIIMPSSEPTG